MKLSFYTTVVLLEVVKKHGYKDIADYYMLDDWLFILAIPEVDIEVDIIAFPPHVEKRMMELRVTYIKEGIAQHSQRFPLTREFLEYTDEQCFRAAVCEMILQHKTGDAAYQYDKYKKYLPHEY